jgi:hypothetical protein
MVPRRRVVPARPSGVEVGRLSLHGAARSSRKNPGRCRSSHAGSGAANAELSHLLRREIIGDPVAPTFEAIEQSPRATHSRRSISTGCHGPRSNSQGRWLLESAYVVSLVTKSSAPCRSSTVADSNAGAPSFFLIAVRRLEDIVDGSYALVCQTTRESANREDQSTNLRSCTSITPPYGRSLNISGRDRSARTPCAVPGALIPPTIIATYVPVSSNGFGDSDTSPKSLSRPGRCP